MFDLLLAGLPAELLSAMRKNKLTNPGTLRSYPRSALGISAGVLPFPESTSSTPTDPGTLLFLPLLHTIRIHVWWNQKTLMGLQRIAEGQGGSGRHDGLTGTDDVNEESSDEGQRSSRESCVLGREGDERIMKSAEPERPDG